MYSDNFVVAGGAIAVMVAGLSGSLSVLLNPLCFVGSLFYIMCGSVLLFQSSLQFRMMVARLIPRYIFDSLFERLIKIYLVF